MAQGDRDRSGLPRGGERAGEHRSPREIRRPLGRATGAARPRRPREPTLIYFDHNASTPVRTEVRQAMRECLEHVHGNASSLHREGQRARAAVDRAREQVARLVNAHVDEVVFVSGGTEGDHLALLGAIVDGEPRARVAISAVEHHAVHGAAEVLAERDVPIDTLPVDRDGVLELEALDHLVPGTVLIAVMLANNETGVVQPVASAVERAHRVGARVHCDAVQAAGKIVVDFQALGADYLALSGHKLGGPKGAGALVVRRGAPLAPLFRGSAQEHGRRGGTENVPGIVGLGVAADCAARDLDAERARLLELRLKLERGLRHADPGVVIHGERVERLPNTVNASFARARSDDLLMALDARGVAVSAGAACASGAVEPSPVLRAMGVPRELAVCAIRISMGHTTTADEVDRLIALMPEVLQAARATSRVSV